MLESIIRSQTYRQKRKCCSNCKIWRCLFILVWKFMCGYGIWCLFFVCSHIDKGQIRRYQSCGQHDRIWFARINESFKYHDSICWQKRNKSQDTCRMPGEIRQMLITTGIYKCRQEWEKSKNPGNYSSTPVHFIADLSRTFIGMLCGYSSYWFWIPVYHRLFIFCRRLLRYLLPWIWRIFRNTNSISIGICYELFHVHYGG